MRRYILVACIFLLSSLYGFLAFLVMNPNVSVEYYNYYIDKSTDLSPKEVEHIQNFIPSVIPSMEYQHSSKDFGFSGWSSAEEKFRWSNAKKSLILFKVDENKIFVGKVRLNFGAMGQQKITLLLNGVEIYSNIIEGNDIQINVNFNVALLKQGINTLEFSLPNARKPGNGDARYLALALKSFQIN